MLPSPLLLLVLPSVASGQTVCRDYTVGSCTIAQDPIWESDQVQTIDQCQLACHSFQHCQVFRFIDGLCSLFATDFRGTSCGVVGGRADTELADCQPGDGSLDGCDTFVEEDCDYLAADTGFSPAPGEVTDIYICQDFCKGFQVLGCEYWVWSEQNRTCLLLSSPYRRCRGQTGPSEPRIEDCGHPADCQQQQFIPESPVFLSSCNTTDCPACPQWDLSAKEGTEVWMPNNSCNPTIALGPQTTLLGDTNFTGSFLALDADDDWIGFVFGYQSPSRFFVVLAPGAVGNNNHTDQWRVTKVDSATGVSSTVMGGAILSNDSVDGQTTVLYHAPKGVTGWKQGKIYSWAVESSLASKLVKISVKEDEELMWEFTLEDSPDIDTITHGRLGLFTYSQPTRFFDLKSTVCS